MAHIVNCMLESDQEKTTSMNQHLGAMSGSPQTRLDPSEKADKSFVWRMYQPERKYQLFPRESKPQQQQQSSPSKANLDPEQAFALAMSDKATERSSPPVSGLRLRLKEHNLNRRRKVSVPELGPMTTVQEVPMDSPTIPGRPPLHERSISAPGHSWKNHHLAEVMIPSAMLVQETAEPNSNSSGGSGAGSPTDIPPPQIRCSRGPLSPKSLAPLVIPKQGSNVNKINRRSSINRLRSGSSGTTPCSARTDDNSPKMLRTPYTPLSALTTPRSAASTAATNSTLPTPLTGSMDSSSKGSPRQWMELLPNVTTPLQERKDTGTFLDLTVTPKGPSATSTTTILNSVITSTPTAITSSSATTTSTTIAGPPTGTSHRRNVSDTGSIMERGRPRKRCDIIPGGISIGGSNSSGPRSASKRSRSADRRAFETLPQGWKPSEAPASLAPGEAAALQKQALQQAARFEVLRRDDVEALSRELRQLDERTEYLRRTYASLRAGRRNLHARICQYLRSPRVAKFSHESMLKQEEALAELDNSIDDWVGKLEQAENRRTRVRQKLLEHVAAAATMPVNGNNGNVNVHGVSESLQMAIGIRQPPCLPGQGSISTPPRSPTRQQGGPSSASSTGGLSYLTSSVQQSPSPKPRFVPSTILEQPLEDVAASSSSSTYGLASPTSTISDEEEARRRRDVQSIRVYAGDDVYALLADVESEFTRMSGGGEAQRRVEEAVAAHEATSSSAASLSEDEQKELHRARSHEMLNSLSKKSSAGSMASAGGSPVRPTAALKESVKPVPVKKKIVTPTVSAAPPPPPATVTNNAGEILLTSAVFRP